MISDLETSQGPGCGFGSSAHEYALKKNGYGSLDLDFEKRRLKRSVKSHVKQNREKK